MIKTIGLEAIQRRLKKLQAKTKDTQPLLNEISNLVINKTEDSFETHTDPQGNKWEKLNDKTKAIVCVFRYFKDKTQGVTLFYNHDENLENRRKSKLIYAKSRDE